MQGTAGFASYVAIDGVGSADGDTGNNNGITSMDAIQEIRVVMNSYTRSSGRNTGPQINVVTKSGGSGIPAASRPTSGTRRSIPIRSPTSASCRSRLRVLHRRRHVRRAGGVAGRRKAQATFFFYAREMWNTKQAATPNTKQMPTGGTHRRFLADHTDERHAVLHRDPLRSGACSTTAGGPGCFPARHPRRSHQPLGRAS